MTLDHALRLLAMLVDTVSVQSQQIDALSARIKELEDADSGNSNS